MLNKLVVLLLFFAAWVFSAFSQSFSVRGTVRDASNGDALPSAAVSLFPLDKHLQTNAEGNFEFGGLHAQTYRLRVQFVGFGEFSTSFTLDKDTVLRINLQPETLHLNELVVKAHTHHRTGLQTASVQEIGRSYLLRNNAANFAQTLASLPGVASMDIGAGFSKPVIRGMAFNRVAVVDKGIVQQNQQWGADHGLEIDQYDVDQARVHKGPLSLLYGSDAMGGVIEILPANVPETDMFWGDATMIAKSNNDLLGASVMASLKRGRWFARARVTAQEYGDYRIPADTITYLTWQLPVHERRMKNTAGRELNASLSLNVQTQRVNSWLHASNSYGKNGFYLGAHGIPSLSRLLPDASARNVEMPYSFSNHFKIIHNTAVQLPRAKLLLDAAFQQNRRQEWSPFHTHYANQQPPSANPDLELAFLLNTYSLSAHFVWHEDKKWTKTVGLSSEFQDNTVKGYSFLLPQFNRFSGGMFLLNTVRVNERFSLSGGIRYDMGRIRVNGMRDEVLLAYLKAQNYSETDAAFYAQRADNLHKTFGDFSGSVGFSYAPHRRHAFKMNLGKSFRYPSANELAANGVHHGAFRHEKGNRHLVSEQGYQLDAEYAFQSSRFSLKISPFATYFSNYIYLNPTGKWSVLPHTGQIYEYNQSRAFMAGGELSAEYAFENGLSVASDVEYAYNYNISDRYPLPFSPPAVVASRVAYAGNLRKTLSHYTFQLENQYVFAQNRIARNEAKTPRASLFHASAHLHWRVRGFGFITDIQVQNIFDAPFLNHLSFYRRLNAPEAGRNMQLILKIPF